GTTREVVLAARARRTLTIPVTIPGRGAQGGGLLRVGELLGEPVDLAVSLQTKDGVARTVRSTATIM
ncbi:MAG TPA: hypothetical protein VHX44_11265, partial [Planctomycetota bacterium]|nr:hypothetical protein [Planctomycetota bacterium]